MFTYSSYMSLSLFQPGTSKVPDVVAYLRSRPSEKAESDEAMSMQRQVLTEMTTEGRIAVVAEFVEKEDDGEDRPAYHAAYQKALSRGCALLTTGWGAIGTGPSFKPPNMSDAGSVDTIELCMSFIRFADVVPIPEGAPATVALWADYRPAQGVTAIYLCNCGQDQLDVVELAAAQHELGLSGHSDRFIIDVEPIPAGMGRLVTTSFHGEWTFYLRYWLSCSSGDTSQGLLEACDRSLNSQWLAEDPSRTWVCFQPAEPDVLSVDTPCLQEKE